MMEPVYQFLRRCCGWGITWKETWELRMSEHSPLVRQWMMLRILSSRHYGVTVKELAQELGVSEKTVRRDLDAFSEAGFPLEETVVEHGRKKWKLAGDLTVKGVPLHYDEAIALHVARCFMEPLAGTIFWSAAQRAFNKIRCMFNERALKYVEKMAQAFYQTRVGFCDYSRQAEIIDQIMIGLEDHRTLEIEYQSLKATEPVTYEIHPYGMTYHRGALYLVGWSPGKKEIRHWKVNRISRAEVTDRRFEIPNDFRLDEHFAGSFGVYQGDGDYHIRVRFSAQVARYVSEARWHASQRLHHQRDGSLIAEFDLESLEEFERWILSFGRHAEVLEPPELVERIRYEVEQMARIYNPNNEDQTLTLSSPKSIFETALPQEEPFLGGRMKSAVSRAQK